VNDSMQHQVLIPLVPAPVAFFALMFGLMMGVMIGRKTATMHGMHAGDACGPGMMRGKMMGMGGMHHHHGDGMPQCTCGEGGQGADRSWEHPVSE